MKVIFPGCFSILTFSLHAQTDATFTVKKPVLVTEERKLPADTFLFSPLSDFDVWPLPVMDDFLMGVDTMYVGETITRPFSQSTIGYGSIETVNLKAEERRGVLTITALNNAGVGEIKLRRRDGSGVNRIFYRHTIKILARPVVSRK